MFLHLSSWGLWGSRETRSSATAGGKSRKDACCRVHFIRLTWLSSHALIADMIRKVLFSSVLRWRLLKRFTRVRWKIFRLWLTGDWANVIWWNISSTGRFLSLSAVLGSYFILRLATWAHLTYSFTALGLFFFSRILFSVWDFCQLCSQQGVRESSQPNACPPWLCGSTGEVFHVVLLKPIMGNSARRKQFSSNLTYFFSSSFFLFFF